MKAILLLAAIHVLIIYQSEKKKIAKEKVVQQSIATETDTKAAPAPLPNAGFKTISYSSTGSVYFATVK